MLLWVLNCVELQSCCGPYPNWSTHRVSACISLHADAGRRGCQTASLCLPTSADSCVLCARDTGAPSLHQDSVLVWELKAADWAGAVVMQPLADAGGAEAVLAGQLQDLAAALEVV